MTNVKRKMWTAVGALAIIVGGATAAHAADLPDCTDGYGMDGGKAYSEVDGTWTECLIAPPVPVVEVPPTPVVTPPAIPEVTPPAVPSPLPQVPDAPVIPEPVTPAVPDPITEPENNTWTPVPSSETLATLKPTPEPVTAESSSPTVPAEQATSSVSKPPADSSAQPLNSLPSKPLAELAHTGTNSSTMLFGLATATLLIVAGSAILALKWAKRDKR